MIKPPPPSAQETDAPPLDRPRRTAITALCKALDFPQLAVERLVETLCQGAMEVLKGGEALDIPGFGHFHPRPYRAPHPSSGTTPHPWDPSELPYPGPVEFQPSAALLRQLDTDALNTRAVYTCPPLLDALTEVAGVPRSHAAQVLRIFFVTLVDLLLVERACTIPGLGSFVNARRPTQLIVDVRNDSVKGVVPRTVRYRPSPTLLAALPSTHRHLSFNTAEALGIPLVEMLALDTPEEAPLPRVRPPLSAPPEAPSDPPPETPATAPEDAAPEDPAPPPPSEGAAGT